MMPFICVKFGEKMLLFGNIREGVLWEGRQPRGKLTLSGHGHRLWSVMMLNHATEHTPLFASPNLMKLKSILFAHSKGTHERSCRFLTPVQPFLAP